MPACESERYPGAQNGGPKSLKLERPIFPQARQRSNLGRKSLRARNLCLPRSLFPPSNTHIHTHGAMVASKRDDAVLCISLYVFVVRVRVSDPFIPPFPGGSFSEIEACVCVSVCGVRCGMFCKILISHRNSNIPSPTWTPRGRRTVRLCVSCFALIVFD